MKTKFLEWALIIIAAPFVLALALLWAITFTVLASVAASDDRDATGY